MGTAREDERMEREEDIIVRIADAKVWRCRGYGNFKYLCLKNT